MRVGEFVQLEARAQIGNLRAREGISGVGDRFILQCHQISGILNVESKASLVGRNDLARLTGRLDLKVTYCTDEACSTPGIVQGPICEDHLKALLSGLKVGDISALLCGPPGMMDKVSDAFLSLGIQMADIHYERFDYAAGRSRIDKRRRAIAFAILGMVVASAFMFSLR